MYMTIQFLSPNKPKPESFFISTYIFISIVRFTQPQNISRYICTMKFPLYNTQPDSAYWNYLNKLHHVLHVGFQVRMRELVTRYVALKLSSNFRLFFFGGGDVLFFVLLYDYSLGDRGIKVEGWLVMCIFVW